MEEGIAKTEKEQPVNYIKMEKDKACYLLGLRFSTDGSETIDDKIKKLIRREMGKEKA